jgi:hypothetical protein
MRSVVDRKLVTRRIPVYKKYTSEIWRNGKPEVMDMHSDTFPQSMVLLVLYLGHPFAPTY